MRKALVWYFNLSFWIYYWPWLAVFAWRMAVVKMFTAEYWWTCGLAIPILVAFQFIHYGGWLVFGLPAYRKELRGRW